MTKFELIIGVGIPAFFAIMLTTIGKRMIVQGVNLPSHVYTAGAMFICTGLLCASACCIAILLIRIIGNQKK